MAGQENSNSWKKKISCRLQERNKRQNDMFAEMIKSHSRILDYAEGLKSTNQRLSLEISRLKSDDEYKPKDSGLYSHDNGNAQLEKVQMLEQKLYRVQEELMELHKRKGENTQQIIDLNTAIQDRDKKISVRDAKIAELESQLSDMSSKCKQLEQASEETSLTNQCLTDELQALQMAYTALEGTLRRLQEDNQELVSRWMALKAKDADRVNEENELFMREKHEKLRLDLQRAASEDVGPLGPRLSLGDVPAFVMSVPSRALGVVKDAHDGEVNAVQWSPVGRFFVTGGSDRKLKVWEVHGGKCEPKFTLIGANAGITSVDIDIDEKVVLGASNDFASRLWTIGDQRLRHTLTGHSGKVLAAKFMSDPNKVVSGSHDRTLKVWDVRTKACVKTLFAGSSCNDVVVVDGMNVIGGHFDKKIRFYDLRSDSSTTREILLEGRITSLDLTKDRTLLLGLTRENHVAVVDLRTSNILNTLSADGFHVGVDWARATFSPDGAYVVAGSTDGGVYIWEVATSKLHSVLREHSDGVMACAWNPNGRSLLSCDKHKTVVYWSDI